MKKLEKKLNVNGDENIEIQAIKDFELDPRTRRAKIVMQTCAHISGAAYLYKASCLQDRVSEIKKKVWIRLFLMTVAYIHLYNPLSFKIYSDLQSYQITIIQFLSIISSS